MSRRIPGCCRLAAIVLLMAPALSRGEDFSLSAEDYLAAENLDSARFAALVRNAYVKPRWIGTGDQFWYTREGGEGHSVILVDAASGQRRPAFDLELMTRALDPLIGSAAAELAPFPTDISLEGEERRITFQHGARTILCSGEAPACRFGEDAGTDPEILVAPGARHGVFVRDHNLWLRDLSDNSDTALTRDGERLAAYASGRDQERLMARETGSSDRSPPQGTYWSPAGHWLITRKLDERGIKPYPFLESAPADGSFRPRVHEVRIPLLGDEKSVDAEHFVIDVRSASLYPVELPEGFDLDDPYPGNQPLGWSEDGELAYLYVSSVDARAGRLVELDMATGKTRVVLEERAEAGRLYLAPLGSPAMVRIKGSELIWFSERSNYGHLYLHDLGTGALKRQLTRGEGAVSSILHVDFDRRSALISRARGGDGIDPYQQYVFRISLDGGEPVLLTPEKGHHAVGQEDISPGGEYFVESYSTMSTPPRSLLRSARGAANAVELEVADAGALFKLGWKPPGRIRLRAADGETEILAALYRAPDRYASHAPLPIIDLNYINPIAAVAPVSFMQAVNLPWPVGITELGFHVVLIDGRGTPKRSRDFRNAGYPAFADIQIEDHVAAIRQLAEKHANIDADRVGIWGSSNGGAGAARAILRRPDFFKVAVAAAGSHDYMSLPPSGIKFFGAPMYAGNTSVRPAPGAVPENYLPFDNAPLAANLQGRLLLAYGDMDNIALPGTTHRLANALIREGKFFDLLHMPNRGHLLMLEPYFKRRMRHYFVEHLHGIDPPRQ